jgi:hypothetical protein
MRILVDSILKIERFLASHVRARDTKSHICTFDDVLKVKNQLRGFKRKWDQLIQDGILTSQKER